ncbi:uncharacterized protein LOC143857292 isoform X1 [Tasmannia lanceolata]|uniref:uncharacterized protein LOC143857292 isoform X1 n=1 Tax=Tasmannia lanceolata TaxID=3420 RepID=UPI004064A148
MLGPGPTPSRLFGSSSGGKMWQEKAASLEKANDQLNNEVASDDLTPPQQHVPPTSSQGDGLLVTLMSIRRQTVIVARGICMSVDPSHVVDDEPLGEFFTEVLV